MPNLNEIEITVYRGVRDTAGHRGSLGEFLACPDVDAIEALRSSSDPEERRQIKQALPQATVSGIFEPSRRADRLVRHSGLICVDIDAKDNPCIGNADLTAHFFAMFDEILYAARSVGGRGYFAIIPLRYPERHKEHFLSLVRRFDARGITVDRACGDVCRLRCQSYDPRPYHNPAARPYEGLYAPPRPVLRPFAAPSGEAEARVAALCRSIAQQHLDLTADYSDWVRLGAALSTLGEAGRRWYHIISAQNPGYDPAVCDRKFDNLLRTNRRITLGTFFYLCRAAGVRG